jgi:hypothetical protein
MAIGRSLAVCDPAAFRPFFRLVEGPLTDPNELEAAERFIRTVVLHDELTMGFEPRPSGYVGSSETTDILTFGGQVRESPLAEEHRKKVALAAEAGVSLDPAVPTEVTLMVTERGFDVDKYGYGLFGDNLIGQPAPTVELSLSQLEIVSLYSHAEEGSPCYDSHLRYLQQLFGIVNGGGSVLCEHSFACAATGRATQFDLALRMRIS